MRTISKQYAKGHEQPRTLKSNLQLLRYILFSAGSYIFQGSRLRSTFKEGQKRRTKIYIDDFEIP